MALYRSPVMVAEPYEDVGFSFYTNINRLLIMHRLIHSHKGQIHQHRPRRRSLGPSTKTWRE